VISSEIVPLLAHAARVFCRPLVGSLLIEGEKRETETLSEVLTCGVRAQELSVVTEQRKG
jgi:hypothetical protein